MDTTQPTPAEQEPKQTRITTVSVRVKQELDAGYAPFIRYMKKNAYKTPPFGMRDATRATMEVWMSAEVGTDMTVEQVINMLSQQGHAIVDNELRQHYPNSFFSGGAKVAETPAAAEIGDEAYVIQSTEIVDGPTWEY